jgi:RNA polymerase sigma factor (TIGR02999 family)
MQPAVGARTAPSHGPRRPRWGTIGGVRMGRTRMSSPSIDLGETIAAWRAGKVEAEAVLSREVYLLLKRMAGARLAHSGPATLEATGLVHEAVARLLGGNSDWTSREHFFALAAMQMRAVLVDAARCRMADKRGAGAVAVTLGGTVEAAVDDDGMLELHEALLRLAERDPRASRVVEMTYFGGMRAHEIAPVIGVSDATVERDLAFGRSWLRRELHP